MPGEMKDRFKMIIKEFHEKELPEVVERQDVMDFSMLNSRLKKIVTIVGARRAGKTYFLYQIMKEILQGSAGITDILYVNFEDERITPIKAENEKRTQTEGGQTLEIVPAWEWMLTQQGAFQ